LLFGKRERAPHVDGTPENALIERGRHHAYHRRGTAVDPYLAANDLGIAAEPACPEAMADNHDRFGARSFIFGHEPAPQLRLHPEHGKEISRYEHAGFAFGRLTRFRQGETCPGERRKSLERVVVLLIMQKTGDAERPTVGIR